MGHADNLRCAVCSQIYGILTGSMPKGTMGWELIEKGHMPCAGFEDCATWLISYNFPSGV